MLSTNQVILVGNLGQAPELKHLPSGSVVCNFTLCTTEQWTGKDGKPQKRTEWHACVLYGESAQSLTQNATKGSLVSVEGRLQTRSWEKDGKKNYKTEVIVATHEVMNKTFKPDTSSQDAKDFTKIAERIASNDHSTYMDDTIPF